MRKILLLGGILLSAVLTWFAVSNYQTAGPIAEENLRGLALSLAAAIEKIALNDPTLHNLSTFQTHDIAYFALIDRAGLYRFHTNTDLIGKSQEGPLPLSTLRDGAISNARIRLQTGENAFEFNAPLYIPNETLALRLTLHTHRADIVIRRARLNLIVLFSLLAAGWFLAFVLYRITRREEQYHLEMARRESLAQLGEMGAMMAHEIRNPLAGIKGFAQMIEKNPQDERSAGFAKSIVTETKRLEILVNDLLVYAKSDRDSMNAVDLGKVVSQSADFLRHEAEHLHINIISQCQEKMLIIGSRDRLSQVLLNLGKNALQAMPDGGTLRITAAAEGRQVIIKVIDDGHGISQEELPRVFEPFFTTKARGTGLGLALCRKIVEEHGGRIEVQSAAGQGTTISITIPGRQNHQVRSRS